MASSSTRFRSLSRRDWMRYSGMGLVGASVSGWLPQLAAQHAEDKARKRSCILLWMNGGPSQLDTFDMKTGHANGGPFQTVSTSVPGLRWSEHLPQLAKHAQRLAVVRSVSTKEGDHGRGTYLMRTGITPGGPIAYPTLGSVISKELGTDAAELPNYVSISPSTAFNPAAFGPGFLGPSYAASTVGGSSSRPAAANRSGYAELRLDDLELPADVDKERAIRRGELWKTLQQGFLASHPRGSALAHQLVYEKAIRLMRSEAGSAFNLEEEPSAVRDAYGKGRFGQGCLLARRLVERGVPFVEVTLGALTKTALAGTRTRIILPR
jgi:hypothetical protein